LVGGPRTTKQHAGHERQPEAGLICSAPHIVFSGGGSGGHLTPSLAVAEQIRSIDRSARVTFFTSGRSVDHRVMQESAVCQDLLVSVVPLPLVRLPGRRLTAAPADAWRCWRSLRIGLRYLRKNPVSVMLGTGAFASLPGLLAAKRLRIPTVLFEANVATGGTNRWMAGGADIRLTGWPTEATDSGWEVVGIPIRSTFGQDSANTERFAGTQPSRHALLITGGSQGARRLNQIVCEALEQLNIPKNWSVLHQTGPETELAPGGSVERPNVTTTPFIKDMATVLDQASLVISRAGAVTLAEIAASGCPSILIPLSSAADSHQARNAALFVNSGAASVISEQNGNAPGILAEQLRRLFIAPASLRLMSENARSLHTPGAAERIAERLLQVASCPLQSNNTA